MRFRKEADEGGDALGWLDQVLFAMVRLAVSDTFTFADEYIVAAALHADGDTVSGYPRCVITKRRRAARRTVSIKIDSDRYP
jgi:hypothetical protein